MPRPILSILLVATASLLLASIAPRALVGQTASYTLIAPDFVIEPGSPDFEARFILDSSQGNAVYAATFGVCSDESVIVPSTISQGVDMQALRNGAGPSFFAGTVTPPGGFTIAWIADFLAIDLVPPTADFEMVVATYTPVGANGDRSSLVFCSGLGNPSVSVRLYLTSTLTAPVSQHRGSALITFGEFALLAPPVLVVGTPFGATVTLHAPNPVEGFRFGLGHDSGLVDPVSVDPSAFLDTTHGGTGPELFIVDLTPAGGDGLTVECEVSIAPPFETLPAGLTEIVDIGYDAIGPVGGGCTTAVFTFRGDLGSPPVPLEVLVAGVPLPGSETPTESSIERVLPPPTGGVTLEVASRSGLPGTEVAVPVLLDTDCPVQAFSFSVVHDSPEFVLTSIEPGSAVAGLTCSGFGPGYFESVIPPGGTEGGSVLALLDFVPIGTATVLSPAAGQEVVLLHYQVPISPSTGGTTISFTDQFGNPPLAIEVTVNSLPVTPVTLSGELSIGVPFVRGRCNSDAAVNIADPIHFLGFLFPLPGSPPSILGCADACDANDDGTLNIADAVAFLAALFAPVTPLPPPSMCGSDPTSSGDPLGCDFSSCP